MAEKLEALRLQFQRIDLDGSGCINASELTQAMLDANFIGVREETINNIISEIDYVGNGKINYTEFLAATLTFSETLSDEMLQRLFKKFDVDNSGYITKENLLDAFKRLGRNNLTLDDVTEMIKVHDTEQDHVLSFNEFKVIFSKDLSPLNLTKQDSLLRPMLTMTPGLAPKSIFPSREKINNDSLDSQFSPDASKTSDRHFDLDSAAQQVQIQ